MAVRLTKKWQPLADAAIRKIGAHMGVYQLANAAGEVLYIGFAGGSSHFGLRGLLNDHLVDDDVDATQFRIEITTAYHSRYRELLQVHVHDHGCAPSRNSSVSVATLGRLRLG